MSTHKRFNGIHVFLPRYKVSEAYLKTAKETELRIAKKYAKPRRQTVEI